MSEKHEPFSKFGQELKRLRLSTKETIDGLSSALEIDKRVYSLIEKGAMQPPEDIVMMLINRFSIIEPTAEKLWDLAGYHEVETDKEVYIENSMTKMQPIMVLPQDLRIVYTDMVHIVVNNYGMTINFMQGGGNGQAPLAVARIGMSKEHAQSVAKVITDTLAQHFDKNDSKPRAQKLLPPKRIKKEESEK
jgi:transcriptional regulator with XRE-family HTH domain